MPSTYLSSDSITAGGSATNTLTISAFALSGSNRNLYVFTALSVGTTRTISSVVRGSDTFSIGSSSSHVNLANQFLHYANAEPQTASATLAVTEAAAATGSWSIGYVAVTDSNQTTRVNGIQSTVADAQTTRTLNMVSAVGDLILTGLNVPGSVTGIAATGTGHSVVTSQSTGNVDNLRMGKAAGAASLTVGYSWTTSEEAGLIGWNSPAAPADTPPTANVTADATPITYLNIESAIPSPPTVTEGTNDISSIAVSCDVGTINMTAIAPVTITNNGTASVTLQNGTTAEQYNAVLATMTHTRSTHGVTTFTIAPTDGTLSDSENFTRYVSPIGVEFSGTQAQVLALIQSLGVVMDAGETSASLVLYVEDDTSPTPLTDEQTVVLVVGNTRPTIMSNGGGDAAAVNVFERQTFVTTVTAVDADGDDLTYSISGGADAALFTIDATTGLLAFLAAPDFESPADAGADNIYEVTVQVSDGTRVDSQTITVTVLDSGLTADAGFGRTVQVGSLVQLDGSNSEEYSSVAWAIIGLPAGSLAVLSDSAIVNPTFLADLPGEYTVRLIVYDAASPPNSNEAEILISASELAAIAPMFVAASRPPTVPGNRRKAGVPASTIELWKYPKDLYDVAVDWEEADVLPAGATSLSTLTVVVKDSGGSDVTVTLLASSGVEGFVSWAQLQAGTAGQVYDVILTQLFNNGQRLDRYVKVQVRDPRSYVVHAPFKYPSDKYPIPVEWAGRRPRGNPALSTLITKAYDAVDTDETSTYVAGSFVTGTIGAGYVIGGTGGESRLLEFAQEFSNGRKFHEYALLTVEVPPA